MDVEMWVGMRDTPLYRLFESVDSDFIIGTIFLLRLLQNLRITKLLNYIIYYFQQRARLQYTNCVLLKIIKKMGLHLLLFEVDTYTIYLYTI